MQRETEKRANVLNPNENQSIRKEVSHFTMQTERAGERREETLQHHFMEVIES